MAPSWSPMQDRGRLEEAEELYRQVLESGGRLSFGSFIFVSGACKLQTDRVPGVKDFGLVSLH